MNRTLLTVALLLTANCSRQEQPAPAPANDVAATPAAPAPKAAVAALKGSWKVTGPSGLTATFTGAQATLASGCMRRAWTYSQTGNTVAFKSSPGGSSNCGQSPSAAQEGAFSTLDEANLAVFGDDGRTVMLSGLGGTLQLEQR